MSTKTSFYFVREISGGRVVSCVAIKDLDDYDKTIDEINDIHDSGHITKKVFQLVKIDAKNRDFADRYVTEYTHPALCILTETTFSKKGTEDHMNQVAMLACVLSTGQLFGEHYTPNKTADAAIELAECILNKTEVRYRSVVRVDKTMVKP